MQRNQHDKIETPDAEMDLPSEEGQSEHSDMRSARSIFIVAACVLVACILWSLEPWQRPEILRNTPEVILLWTACLGILGLAVMVGLRLKTTRPWRWMLVFGLCGFGLLGGMRLFSGRLALMNLENRIDEHITGLISLHGSRSTSISETMVCLLGRMHVPAPDWLSKHAEESRNYRPPTTRELIASSSFRLRLKLADSMVRTNARAGVLMQLWNDYFPAITGPDVKLEMRNEWISRLDVLRQDTSLSDDSHQTAIFCMALIILTDPPEFEKWRVPVRDAMLAWTKPSRQDAWIRTLDTLIAMDPPGSWIALSKPLTANHDLFRSAMAVPVRGLAGQIDALEHEFEYFQSLNDFHASSEMWHGAGASLEAWPDIFEKSETEKIRNWQRDVLFRQLIKGIKNTRYELAHSKNRTWLEFTPEQKQQLSTTASDWARQASEKIDSTSVHTNPKAPELLASIRRILPHLTKEQQDETGRLLIPVMLRPDLFTSPGRMDSINFDDDWVGLLWKVQTLMKADQQKILQTALIPLMEKMNSWNRSSHILLCIDAWSDMPALTPEKWLAIAWAGNTNWRIAPRDTPRESLDPFADDPIPVPPLTDSVVKKLASHLDSSFVPCDPKTFVKKFNLVLNGGDPSQPFSPDVTRSNYNRLHNWHQYGALASHSLEELLQMRLYERGLRMLDQEGFRMLKTMVKNEPDIYWWWAVVNRSINRISLWNDVRITPEEVSQWIRKCNFMAWENLLATLEKNPPDQAIIRAIWNELLKASKNDNPGNKHQTFGALLRMAHFLPRDERLAMRRDSLAAYRNKEIRSSMYDDYIYDCDHPLTFLGGGLGISWEDDQLSASLSWSSNIERQVHSYPRMRSGFCAKDVFAFLALGSDREWLSGQGTCETADIPRLKIPFEPTPWQKARELHLRRPDLDIK